MTLITFVFDAADFDSETVGDPSLERLDVTNTVASFVDVGSAELVFESVELSVVVVVIAAFGGVPDAAGIVVVQGGDIDKVADLVGDTVSAPTTDDVVID